MYRCVYSGRLKLLGEEHEDTLGAASNYACTLTDLKRFKESEIVLRKVMPVARRLFGNSHNLVLRMRWNYAETLYLNPGAKLDDLSEAVTTLEDAERIARRVLGGTHPTTEGIEDELRSARVVLAARETPSPPSETV